MCHPIFVRKVVIISGVAQRRACPGKLDISFDPNTDQIHWLCPECGDEGVVSGWEGLIWDMMDFQSDSIN